MNRGLICYRELREAIRQRWESESDRAIGKDFDVRPRVVAEIRARMGLVKERGKHYNIPGQHAT